MRRSDAQCQENNKNKKDKSTKERKQGVKYVNISFNGGETNFSVYLSSSIRIIPSPIHSWWYNPWYNPPHSQITVLIQSDNKRAGKITLDPSHPAHSLFELLLSGQPYKALSTRTTRHRNSFFPQAIRENLILNMEHITLLYNYLFTTHTYFFFSNLHVRPHT